MRIWLVSIFVVLAGCTQSVNPAQSDQSEQSSGPPIYLSYLRGDTFCQRDGPDKRACLEMEVKVSPGNRSMRQSVDDWEFTLGDGTIVPATHVIGPDYIPAGATANIIVQVEREPWQATVHEISIDTFDARHGSTSVVHFGHECEGFTCVFLAQGPWPSDALSWNVGDNSTYTGVDPARHQYPAETGAYNVILSVNGASFTRHVACTQTFPGAPGGCR